MNFQNYFFYKKNGMFLSNHERRQISFYHIDQWRKELHYHAPLTKDFSLPTLSMDINLI
jgi:hypothetical protein